MNRDVSKLQHGPFDVLVVGGGIYGCWIAYHAACAGLKVALVEKSDWAGGTSSASSKLLHGGLRYLERFQFGMVRKSLLERRELHERMPHHVRPLEFLLPVFQQSRVGRFRLNIGLWIYDLLAGKNQPVPGHRYFGRDQCLNAYPDLKPDDLLAAFSYGDCGTDDSRLLLEIVESAQQAGAVTCNYVSVSELLRSEGRVTGARLCDLETNATIDLKSTLVVNAAGPWVDQLITSDESLPAIRRTKGVHLVMPAMQSVQAMLLTAESDGRVFFLIPWYGRTLLGTTDTDYHDDPKNVCVTSADIDYLLNAANNRLKTNWTIDDVQGTFAGLRTMLDDSSRSASGVSREWLLDDSIPGLMTSIGGKYTSARVDAVTAVDRILNLLRKRDQPSSDQPLAWWPGPDFSEWQQQMCAEAQAVGIDSQTALNGTRRYGSQMANIIAIAESDANMTDRIVSELPFCRAEVVHCAQHEMSRTLVDILRRRIPLMLLIRLKRETAMDVCQIAGDILGWDRTRRTQETDRVMKESTEWCSKNGDA